jgi:hypothetical protein
VFFRKSIDNFVVVGGEEREESREREYAFFFYYTHTHTHNSINKVLTNSIYIYTISIYTMINTLHTTHTSTPEDT